MNSLAASLVEARKSQTIWFAGIAVFVALWFAVYNRLSASAQWLVAQTAIEPGSHLASSLEFFLYDTPKVLMLLTLVVFAMGVVRTFFSPERTRRLLAGRREGLGNIAAAHLGIVTPFCSCSAVPLFVGFVSAGVPLGVTFSFLIAAPMVNEIALGLLFALLGWQVALTYLAFDRFEAGWAAVKEIVGKVWYWIIAGIAVGAFIHGYVPAELLSGVMGADRWWSVPAAVLIGIPMYSNAAGIIPVIEALLGKGAALGTVLAFMMSVIALSLPELIILRKVLSMRLIAVFVAVVGSGILAVGFLFNALFT